MMKILAGALAVTGAVWFTAPAPANAAPRLDGVQTTTQTDLSAARRHRRVYYRSPRVYRAPAYYGYYGPTYYDRPYARPAPMWFGGRGWW